MTDEEYQRELEEAERLQRQINNVIDQINRTNRENAKLEVELDNAIQNVSILISNCGELDKAVYSSLKRAGCSVFLVQEHFDCFEERNSIQ